MKRKLSTKEVLKKIKKAAKEGRVRFAPSDKLSQYTILLDDFMQNILGIDSYFLSDYSTIDEYDSDKEAAFKRYSDKIYVRYGVRMKVGTKGSYYMHDIMRKLSDKISKLKD